MQTKLSKIASVTGVSEIDQYGIVVWETQTPLYLETGTPVGTPTRMPVSVQSPKVAPAMEASKAAVNSPRTRRLEE